MGILGFLAILVFTYRYGAAVVGEDAVVYLSAARSLLAGDGYLTYRGDPLLDWPPLYPTVVAGFALISRNVAAAARYLDAVCFGLTVFLSHRWLRRRVAYPVFANLGAAAVLAAVPLVTSSVGIMTDALFILLVLLFLETIGRFGDDGRQVSLLLSGGVAAAACLTRFIGVTLVVAGLVLVFARRGTTVRRRIWDAAEFGAVSAIPSALWAVRTYLLSATLTGERGPSPYSLVENLSFAAATMAKWFLPVTARTPHGVASAAGIVVGIAVVAVLAVTLLRASLGPERIGRTSRAEMLPLALFPTVYIVWLVASSTAIAFSPISDRLLAPIYVPLIYLVVLAVDGARQRSVGRSGRLAAGAALVAVFALWLAYPVARTLKYGKYYIDNGAGGYASDDWQKSESLTLFNAAGLTDPIWSNAPDAVYFFTGRHAIYGPRKSLFNSPASTDRDNLALFRESLARDGEARLVWFQDVPREHLYSLAELSFCFILEPVAETTGGAVFAVRPVADPREVRPRTVPEGPFTGP